jgi:cytoskeletal protein RodZ
MKRQVGIVVGALLALAAVVAIVVWLVTRDTDAAPESPSTSPSVESPSPTPSATDDDVSPSPSPSDNGPSPDPDDDPVDEGASSTIPGASAVLTLATWDAGSVLVGGFVTGVMEDGGACVFTVTAVDTGAVTSYETQGSLNVDSTTCGSHQLEAPTSQTGEYRVRMMYTNSTGKATSESTTLERP